MISIDLFFYNLLIVPLLRIVFYLMSAFNSKVRQGVKGRRHLFADLEETLRAFHSASPRFWIHNSSMGEFEQAKPLILELKRRFPQCLVVVSFFSPSGLAHVKSNFGADGLCYLPFDSRANARRFFKRLRPDAGLVIRHDIWPNHMLTARRFNIPLALVNCSTGRRPAQNGFTRKIERVLHQFFSLILTVSQESETYCKKWNLGCGDIHFVGDTRYDQVAFRAREAESVVAPLRKLKNARQCFVAGSTWPADEACILDALEKMGTERSEIWLILVPHEPKPDHIRSLSQNLENRGISHCALSDLKAGCGQPHDVLIVDEVGILASLYVLADMAYVGGGFGVGIHSVLEPAVFGIPVMFGPNHGNSYEATAQIKQGVGFEIQDADSLFQRMDGFLHDPAMHEETGKRASEFVQANVGATRRIVHHIENGLLKKRHD